MVKITSCDKCSRFLHHYILVDGFYHVTKFGHCSKGVNKCDNEKCPYFSPIITNR